MVEGEWMDSLRGDYPPTLLFDPILTSTNIHSLLLIAKTSQYYDHRQEKDT
jgi:hypothetical protein